MRSARALTALRLGTALAALSSLAACGGNSSSPAPASLSISPATVAFPAQQPGSVSPPLVVTVSNPSATTVSISAVQLAGGNAGPFSLRQDCGVLPPGGSCQITLTFAPSSAGTAAASLNIASSLAPSPLTVAVTGSAVTSATWTTLVNAPPASLGFCLLLTDATVMCQAAQDWYRLTPTATGGYVYGTWSWYTSFPANYVPQAFASAVLADGRVVVVGGEYLGVSGQWDFALSNGGAVFDPTTLGWRMLAPPPASGSPNHWACIGDAPSAVLPDERLMIGSKLYQDLAALDPATLSWTQLAAPGKADINTEEGWTLLPDGSALTLDVTLAPRAERLVLAARAAAGAWVTAGPTPVDLHTPSSVTQPLQAPGCPSYSPPGEMGPALLLPSGDVFALGANGSTAIYFPISNAWMLGPTVPDGLHVEDGPAVVLPSGHVLFAASPGASGNGLQYYEFDGAQLLAMPLPAGAAQDSTAATSLLPLPNGQVLFVDGSAAVQVYSPALAPTFDPSWAPTITAAPATVTPGGASYQVTGTQFNGLTQASAYGDESQNATNYPLVRITHLPTGHVSYARAHDHSTMGVATGARVVSTLFDVPVTIERGASQLQVVANGISSAPVPLTVQ